MRRGRRDICGGDGFGSFFSFFFVAFFYFIFVCNASETPNLSRRLSLCCGLLDISTMATRRRSVRLTGRKAPSVQLEAYAIARMSGGENTFLFYFFMPFDVCPAIGSAF